MRRLLLWLLPLSLVLLAGCGAAKTQSHHPTFIAFSYPQFQSPQLTGTPTQGQTLTTTNGTWNGTPTSFSYQWQDCNTSGGACSNINAATASTYVLAAGDVGDTVRSVVTASNAFGAASASSAVTATVASSGSPSLTCDLNATTANFSSMISAATPGQVVCLASGTYSNWTGTSKSAPGITVTAGSGQTVTMGLGDWSLGSVQNFTVDGTGGGGTWTIPVGSYLWQGSTTTARNITVKNITMATSGGSNVVAITIDGPTNSAITLDHIYWPDLPSVGICTGTGVRLHLSYTIGSPTVSGVTVSNSEFDGGAWDAIQLGEGANIIDDYFHNVTADGNGACHTDSVQSLGATNTVIKGDWFWNSSDAFGGFDGPTLIDFENDVCSTDTDLGGCVTTNNDQGSTISHNTFTQVGSSTDVDLTSKATYAASNNTVLNNNSFGHPATSTIIALTTSGGCVCTATPASIINNMYPAGDSLASGYTGSLASDFTGVPTFQGGSSFPLATHDSYLLTTGSNGHNGASDGTDVGTAAIGAVTYGP